MRLLSSWTVVGALLGAVTLAGCQVTGDRAGGDVAPAPVVVTVINPRGDEMRPFVNEVTRLSRGHLVLQGWTAGWEPHQVSAEPDALRAVADGHATLGLVPARAFDTVGVTSFDALDAPLLVDSLAFETKVLESSDLTRPMLAGVEPLGLTGLGILPGPMRKPVGLTHELLAPDDYRGARIALSPSVVGQKVLRALGAVAVPSAFNGAVLAGVDGLEQQTESVAGNQYDPPGSTIIANVNLSPRPLVLVAGTAAFRRLAPTDQLLLRQAAAMAIGPTAEADAAAAADGAAMLCRRGNLQFVRASDPQVAAMKAALAPVTAELRHDPASAQAMDGILALRAGYESAANAEAPICLPRQSDSGSAGPTGDMGSILDGVYAVTTTPADGEFTPENWGHWVYVLDRGRLAFTQENATSCTWGYGRYALRGQQMAWDMAGGGGLAPTGAVNKPGEHFVFSWSLYEGVLTLGPVTPTTPGKAVDDNSPSNFRVRPWHRVSATPTATALSSRCPPPATGLASPLDGTWRTTFTKQALVNSPLLLDSGEVNDQNWGTLSLTFHGDIFTIDQRNPLTHSQDRGTFSIAGDALRMNNEKGEVFAMRWSVYRNQLTLRRDASLGVGPTGLVLQPFAKVPAGG